CVRGFPKPPLLAQLTSPASRSASGKTRPKSANNGKPTAALFPQPRQPFVNNFSKPGAKLCRGQSSGWKSNCLRQKPVRIKLDFVQPGFFQMPHTLWNEVLRQS